MGNQNTSGIVEEEGKNEAPDNGQGVSSPSDAVIVEKQTVVQENATEAEADKIPPVEIQECDKDIEDFEGSDAVMDISTNGLDLGEGRSKLSDEEQDQPCTLTGEMQNHPAVNATSDIQEEQNVSMEEALDVDDRDAKKSEEDLVVADAASLEGSFPEVFANEEELQRDNEPPQEEQSNSFNSVLDSSTSENEHKNESIALDHEEKPMIHELGNSDELSDQETNRFLIRCSSDPTEVIKAEFEGNGDELLEDAEKQEKPTDQNVLEKTLHLESETSAAENGYETERETTEKCVIALQSSTEIDTQRLSNNITEAETPPTSNETVTNASCIGAQVELRKSPSFDFGISFDTRSEESDQTPLLYQDKTARRSLSTCSNLRFPNTIVQTEFVGKPLQFQAVQVEEKTIRMERSNSENAQNSLNNKQEKTNAVTKETHENGSNASPSRDAVADSSPKGNGRRKARSSLFTTCICCTAAIS